MARQINLIRLEEIREAIELYPEHRPGWYAEHLGLDCKTVNRALVQLEDKGLTLEMG